MSGLDLHHPFLSPDRGRDLREKFGLALQRLAQAVAQAAGQDFLREEEVGIFQAQPAQAIPDSESGPADTT